MRSTADTVYVEPDDELTSLVAKLTRAGQPEVVFVAPAGTRVLQSLLSLKLLHRQASGAGKHLTLVAADRGLREMARSLGLDVAAPMGSPGLWSAGEQSPAAGRPSARGPGQRGGLREPPSERAGIDGLGQTSRFPSGPGLGRTAATAALEPVAEAPPRLGTRAAPALGDVVGAAAGRPAADSSAAVDHVGQWGRPAGVTWPATGADESEGYGRGEASAGSGLLATVRAAAVPLLSVVPAVAVATQRWVRDHHVAVNPRRLAGPLALLVLALALVWFIGEVRPSAAVALTPASFPFAYDVTVTVNPRARGIEPAAIGVPGRAIQVEESDTLQVPATGRRIVPDRKAVGEVVFNNKSDRPVTVPKGTVVLAGPIKFLTNADVTVPGTVFAGPQQRFGMQKVGVTAAVGGASGNVMAQQVVAIEGPLARTLEVVNVEPTRGGSDRQVTFVTADDRRHLQETLYKTLADRTAARMQKERNERETLLIWPDRADARNPSILEANFDKNVEEESTNLRLRMKLGYGATAFQGDHVNQLMEQVTRLKVQDAKPQFQVVGGTLSLQPPEVVNIENGVVQLLVRAQAQIAPRIDVGQLRADLRQKTPTEAAVYLGALPGLADYTLSIQPEGRQRLPRFGFRISVDVAKPQPAGGQ